MFSRARCGVWFVVALFLLASSTVFGQKPLKVEKVIADYVKASGGKKRLAAIKTATYNWRAVPRSSNPGDAASAGGSPIPVARISVQTPGSWRFSESDAASAASAANDSEPNWSNTVATNGSAVWRSDAAKGLQTLSDAESKALRLQAVLAATRFVDFAKQRIGAQLLGRETIGDESTNAIEFAARNGARVKYYFGATSKMPVKIENPILKRSFCFADYRLENNVLEPHRLTVDCGSPDAQTFELAKVTINETQTAAIFDPPRTLENFDVNALLQELQKNERLLQERIDQYSFVQTSIERQFDDKGQVKKEARKTYEVFPTKIGRAVLKLVSENNVPLQGEKLEKENNRVAKALTEADEDFEKERAKREKRRLEKQTGRGESAPDEAQLERNTVATLLKISELYSPRIEKFRERDMIVVNFRPRVDFKPDNLGEKIFSKLAGTAWIDSVDKQIVRAEARVIDNISFGGFVAKFRKDSALVFERTKFDNDIWLPKLFQANASARFLFASFDAVIDNEYSDYKKYSTDAKGYKLDSPDKTTEKP